jgi:hypothetical protein
MRAVLLEIPKTDEDWDRWSFHHRQDHDVIWQAIRDQNKLNLPEYDLDPIAFDAWDQWLTRNEQAHEDVNGVLGTQGVDLEQLDPKDQDQLEAWVWLHYLEHQTWGTKLGV